MCNNLICLFISKCQKISLNTNTFMIQLYFNSYKSATVKFVRIDVRFKHLKRHQKPVVSKYRFLIVIYYSHLFL